MGCASSQGTNTSCSAEGKPSDAKGHVIEIAVIPVSPEITAAPASAPEASIPAHVPIESSSTDNGYSSDRYKGVHVGDVLLCRDEFQSRFSSEWMAKWRKAEIIAVDERDHIMVHYSGWPDEFDIWVDIQSDPSKLAHPDMLSKEECDKGIALDIDRQQIMQTYFLTGVKPVINSRHLPANKLGLPADNNMRQAAENTAGSTLVMCPVGTLLDVLDIFYNRGAEQPSYKWRKARVVESSGSKIRINYLGWDTKFDESLDLLKDSHRLSEFGTKSTEQTSLAVARNRNLPVTPRKSATSPYNLFRGTSYAADTQPPQSPQTAASYDVSAGVSNGNAAATPSAASAAELPPLPKTMKRPSSRMNMDISDTNTNSSSSAVKITASRSTNAIPVDETAMSAASIDQENTDIKRSSSSNRIGFGLRNPFKFSNANANGNGQTTASSAGAATGIGSSASTEEVPAPSVVNKGNINKSKDILARIMNFVQTINRSDDQNDVIESKIDLIKEQEEKQVEDVMAKSAEAMQEEVEKERAFIDALAAKGLHVIEIDGDGNCLFRAISHQLFLNEEHHEELRARVVEHLVNHKQRFAMFCETDFEEYIKEMAQPGTWGDDLEIRALEELIDRNIYIYSSDSATPTIPLNNNFEETKLTNNATPLCLSYHGHNHYNSIYNEQVPLPLTVRPSRVLLHSRAALFEDFKGHHINNSNTVSLKPARPQHQQKQLQQQLNRPVHQAMYYGSPRSPAPQMGYMSSPMSPHMAPYGHPPRPMGMHPHPHPMQHMHSMPAYPARPHLMMMPQQHPHAYVNGGSMHTPPRYPYHR